MSGGGPGPAGVELRRPADGAAELRALIEVLDPWIDVGPLREVLDRPTRVAVLGRTGSGKTSACNRITGQARPVGLGGVTREIADVPDGAIVWVDTPGIDDPYVAIDRLGPVMDTVDAALWVVDGLQPVTHTEREVLTTLWVPGLPLDVLVGRADLLGEELDAVLDRVREETAAFAPRRVIGRDLRARGDLTDGDIARLRDIPAGPRRQRALADRLAGARRAFAALPVPVDPERLARFVSVRPAVRARMERALSDPEQRSVPDLVVAFRAELEALRDATIVALAADPGLGERARTMRPLPPVPDPGDTLLEALRLGAAGRTAAARELKVLAAAWTAEAEITLTEWAEQVSTDADAAARWGRAHEALTRAHEALGHPARVTG